MEVDSDQVGSVLEYINLELVLAASFNPVASLEVLWVEFPNPLVPESVGTGAKPQKVRPIAVRAVLSHLLTRWQQLLTNLASVHQFGRTAPLEPTTNWSPRGFARNTATASTMPAAALIGASTNTSARLHSTFSIDNFCKN